jgi:hypothetical protein
MYAVVLHFFKGAHAKLTPFTWQVMQVGAKETAKSLGMNFNAARSWYDDRFMRREELSLRYRSSVYQKTSDDFQKSC